MTVAAAEAEARRVGVIDDTVAGSLRLTAGAVGCDCAGGFGGGTCDLGREVFAWILGSVVLAVFVFGDVGSTGGGTAVRLASNCDCADRFFSGTWMGLTTIDASGSDSSSAVCPRVLRVVFAVATGGAGAAGAAWCSPIGASFRFGALAKKLVMGG